MAFKYKLRKFLSGFRKKFPLLAKRLLKYAVYTAILGVAIIVFVFIYFSKDLPDPSKISQRQIIESTKIFDRTGDILLYDIHGEEKRTVVNFDQISPFVKQATVSVEDANFYNHFGLDFRSILRSAFYDILGRQLSQGGSTITQQFIKNSILSREKTFTRKIKEAVLSLEMERKYSKDEILSFYLNQIPYGSNAYGIEAAAQTYFNKSAKDLNLAESAALSALPQSPSRLSPYGSHPEEFKTRQEYVLDRMARYNYISAKEAEVAKKEILKFAPQAHNIKAPHFVMYIKEYLEEKYGQDFIETAGLKVYTTLDWDLQQAAEKIIGDGAKNNWTKYRAYNAALAAIDPKTGQILAMVGSRDYFDLDHDGNVNVTIRDRQPGSSFKPFAYATAFNKGYTADTILFDLKTEFNPNCPPGANQEKDDVGLDCYHPENYDNQFRGPVTARVALSQSLNIPSVQVLYLAGINDTLKTAKNMGITSLNNNYYGLSLVLGGGEVKLLDEVAAYSVFANEGVKNEKTPILKITDSDGKIVEEFKQNPKEILPAQSARLISDILSDNTARTPVFGANSPLYFPDRPVAAKTGTTQMYRDAWTMGYTPSLAVGVWAGNNNNSPMLKSGAGLAAAGPLWHEFIKKAYELKTNCSTNNPSAFCLPKEIENFTKPEPIQTNKAMLNGSYLSIKTLKVDKISGALATEQTPPELIEERSFKEVHNILYFVQKDKPQGDYPKNPTNDTQYKNWEAIVSIWLTEHNEFNETAPSENDKLHTTENLPKIKIVTPFSGAILNQNNFNIQANASAPLGVSQVDFFLDDRFIGSSLTFPYQITASLPIGFKNNTAILKARAYDSAFNRQEDQIMIYFNH